MYDELIDSNSRMLKGSLGWSIYRMPIMSGLSGINVNAVGPSALVPSRGGRGKLSAANKCSDVGRYCIGHDCRLVERCGESFALRAWIKMSRTLGKFATHTIALAEPTVHRLS